jgi:hypothetical protein
VIGTPYFTQRYFFGSTGGEADAANAATATFLAAIEDAVSGTLSWTINTEAEFVDPVTGQVTGVETTPGGTGVGDAAGDMLSPASQGLLRWRTGIFANGKEIRGRTFIPGPTETVNLEGHPSDGYFPVVNEAASALITGSAGAGGLCIWSRTNGETALVISGSCWNQWAVLRSRRD